MLVSIPKNVKMNSETQNYFPCRAQQSRTNFTTLRINFSLPLNTHEKKKKKKKNVLLKWFVLYLKYFEMSSNLVMSVNSTIWLLNISINLISSSAEKIKTDKFRNYWQLSRSMPKPTKWPVRTAKNQISIRPVWSESLVWAVWVVKDPVLLHADSEDPIKLGGWYALYQMQCALDVSDISGKPETYSIISQW